MQELYSTYTENNYGELFYALVRIYQPEKVVELGTSAGYSAYHIARALLANGHGTLDCYDLWEHNGQYSFPKSVAEKNLKEYQHIIRLTLKDAVGIEKKYKMVDILIVDLDNDAEILEKTIPQWLDKVRQLVIVEGGSKDRDQRRDVLDYKRLPIDQWLRGLKNKKAKNLKKILSAPKNKSDQFVIVRGEKIYKEKPIFPWLEDLKKRRGDIEYFTIEPFPSLTIIKKKK